MPHRSKDTLLDHPDEQPFTARLAAAGSLRRELEDLILAAPDDADQGTYQRMVFEDNVTGKRTEASRKKTWTNLKSRYLLNPDIPEFRVFRSHLDHTGNMRDHGLLCFLMMSRTDRTFREIVLSELAQHFRESDRQIDAPAIEGAVRRIAAESSQQWTNGTIDAVRKHLFSSLKDFGLIVGSRNRRTAGIQPGMSVIIFAAQLGKLEGLTDRQVLDARWFHLFGLDQPAVVDNLYAAAQQGSITFRKQAEVVELELPELGAS